MPTIRDLVSALRRRDGVDGVIVLGRDGLLVDGATSAPVDAEAVAALVPSVLSSLGDLGTVTRLGAPGLAVLEHDAGHVVLQVLSGELTLVVLVGTPAALGPLVGDLRRFRVPLSGLG